MDACSVSLELIIPKDAAARVQALALVDHRLRTLPPTRAYKLELKEHRAKHSDEQRGYLWKVVYATIAHECGHTSDEIHAHCKQMFLTIGESEHGIKRTRSTARMDVAELSQYIERVIAWAEVDLGLIIPPALGGFRTT